MTSTVRHPAAADPELATPSPLSSVALVARNDLLRRIRNRSAVITAFVGPVAFAVVFSILVGGASSPTFEIGIVDLDGSEASTELTSALTDEQGDASDEEGDDPVTFSTVADREAAIEALDDGDLDAAIVIPAGFAAAGGPGDAGGTDTTESETLPLSVLRDPGSAIAGQVAESVASSVAARFDLVVTAAELALERTGAPPTAGLLAAAQDAAEPIALGDRSVDGDEVSPAAHYGAAMAILFLFFTAGFAARSVLVEKRDGTLTRVLAGPTTPAMVIAGKTLSVSALALVGFVTVWVVTVVGFDADWGPPVGVLVLMVATVVAVAGVATLVSSLARTPRQAESYTAVVAFAFALLGGNFLGPGQLPDLIERAALFTPNGWALRGFTDLAAGVAAPEDLLPVIGVLLAFGVVFGSVGLARVHRGMIS
jgi:ABC-2 type transport system permease protein